MPEYSPEPYWSRVAEQIGRRGNSFVAGDDDPYYRYKRRRFLRRFLDTIDWNAKVVLEVGPGPGGNLRHLATRHAPRKLLGADVSQTMIDLAAGNLRDCGAVELVKIDGVSLPYPDRSADVSFTATVLQHNTDERMFRALVSELCRVTGTTIFVMEDIGRSPRAGGSGDWIGREVDVYRKAFAECGFELTDVQFLNTKFSRYWHGRVFAFYKRFVARHHQEGDPIAAGFRFLMTLPLPLTRVLDDLIGEERDLARMVFRRA